MSRWKTTHLRPDRCPCCGYLCDAAGSFGERASPHPGDISICVDCQSIMVYDDALRMRRPTDAEMYNIAGDRRIVMAQRMLAEVKRAKRRS